MSKSELVAQLGASHAHTRRDLAQHQRMVAMYRELVSVNAAGWERAAAERDSAERALQQAMTDLLSAQVSIANCKAELAQVQEALQRERLQVDKLRRELAERQPARGKEGPEPGPEEMILGPATYVEVPF